MRKKPDLTRIAIQTQSAEKILDFIGEKTTEIKLSGDTPPLVHVEPSTAIELWLARNWKRVLGLDRIGIHDNFFTLSGDSIKAAILVSNLQQELGEAVPVIALFDAPTIAALGNLLKANNPHALMKLLGEAVGSVSASHELAEPQSTLARLEPALQSNLTARTENVIQAWPRPLGREAFTAPLSC
ncbi:MAG TPA: phosphopantetheine-binding protein, partial [Blastocatellia bacterium]|nr:phosphopantetheine-binding protein [Blastocatellia bacterium]